MTARILSLWATASSRRFRMRAPLKSARQYPSASARYVLQLPVSDKTPALLRKVKECGSDKMVVAPATAMSTSLDSKLMHARWMADVEPAQAESRAYVGP